MRKKILLVDDTATITTLEKLLLGPDYDYVEARNGEEAFQLALSERPDLILMDLNMPVKDGIGGLRSLKGEAATAAIPVVIVTTRSETDAVSQCQALGCAAFLTKPIDKNEIGATVKRLLA
jgi:CheY-like chemotaxis protein